MRALVLEKERTYFFGTIVVVLLGEGLLLRTGSIGVRGARVRLGILYLNGWVGRTHIHSRSWRGREVFRRDGRAEAGGAYEHNTCFGIQHCIVVAAKMGWLVAEEAAYITSCVGRVERRVIVAALQALPLTASVDESNDIDSDCLLHSRLGGGEV
jgi:hypothetical protein